MVLPDGLPGTFLWQASGMDFGLPAVFDVLDVDLNLCCKCGTFNRGLAAYSGWVFVLLVAFQEILE